MLKESANVKTETKCLERRPQNVNLDAYDQMELGGKKSKLSNVFFNLI